MEAETENSIDLIRDRVCHFSTSFGHGTQLSRNSTGNHVPQNLLGTLAQTHLSGRGGIPMGCCKEPRIKWMEMREKSRQRK